MLGMHLCAVENHRKPIRSLEAGELSEVKPRFGWTHADVPEEDIERLLTIVQDQLILILKDDPLPEGYDVTGITVHYENPAFSEEIPEERSFCTFPIMANTNRRGYAFLMVYRLEVKV